MRIIYCAVDRCAAVRNALDRCAVVRIALDQGFSISFSEVPLCLYLIREVPLSNYSVANIVSGASYGWGPGARLRAPVGSRGEAPGSQRVFTV